MAAAGEVSANSQAWPLTGPLAHGHVALRCVQRRTRALREGVALGNAPGVQQVMSTVALIYCYPAPQRSQG